jgi:hypothetical protein
MNKTFLAAAALVVALASPALAQSYDSSIGSGNLDSAPYRSNRHNPIHSDEAFAPHHRTARRAAPAEAYAQSPDEGFHGVSLFASGYRWPYVQYDAQGNMIGPNPVMPGR